MIACMITDIFLLVLCFICAAIHIISRWIARIFVSYGIFFLMIFYIVVRQQQNSQRGNKIFPWPYSDCGLYTCAIGRRTTTNDSVANHHQSYHTNKSNLYVQIKEWGGGVK